MTLFTLITGPTDGEPFPDGDGLAVLLRRLELAHRQAGRPTYRTIGRECGLSASTICRIFNAKKPPPWDNLKRVLRALGLEADLDTTWHELWLHAENDTNPITVELANGLIAPGRQACPACGLWIADPDTHTTHHHHTDALTERVDELQRQLTHLTARITARRRHT
jgi:hypothetical protein